MAISPVLEKRESRLIVKTLLNASKTMKELNDYFLSNKERHISTATLYRRVKELYLAGFLDKMDDGSYKASNHGRMAYNELFNDKKNSDKLENNSSVLVRKLTGKESYVLQKLQVRPSYTSGLISSISISPNNLLEILENLIQLQLSEVIEKTGQKPGRPKKIYKLTERGKLILQELEELKHKIQRRPWNNVQ